MEKTRKRTKIGVIALLCISMVFASGCSAWQGMSKTGQGAAIGGGSGAALGAGVGALAGGGKGAWIGSLVGAAVGSGAGALVGHRMDKQQKELEEQLKNAEIQKVKDSNNLQAIKVTFANGILFATNSSQLTASVKSDLTDLAHNLVQNPKTNIQVFGYTDNTGSQQLNERLSLQRAESVANFLINNGVSSNRVSVKGFGWNDPVASNATPEGRAQNRRVEIYITASADMIKEAQSQN
ncbi:OmpA family protein [Coprobacter tertius]|uniref:OmpA family protein n=1 Tax=Coprobacter tertius TaxID=2944915 RepID=A0ABT1MJT1_9BACT|nr:OmpA family protein [Coprobacter tertius]MCP9612877.1 OmpA family protein [Coprobacter tertius]